MASYPELREKVVLVTGGAAGIGGAASEAFARQGARVAIVDRDPRALEAIVARLHAEDLAVLGLAADVSVRAEVERAVAETVAAYGQINVLVVAAGGFWKTHPIQEIDESEWDTIVTLNLKSVYLTVHAALPHMTGHGWGRIVLVSSWLARGAPVSTAVHYVASKAGMIGMTRQLARELVGEGITVNATAPGVAWSPRIQALYSPEVIARLEALIPQGRISQGAEHAGGILFLASDAASYITGAVLDVNGGGVMP